jgi:Protein of unknown function (DUF2971)
MNDDAVDSSQGIIHEIRQTPCEWLFHYTTLETALVYVLSTRRLRLSPFSRMRDPREYQRWWPSAAGFISDDAPEDVSARAWVSASNRIVRLQDEFKLLSLTMDDPSPEEGVYGRGFARSRLWEAYARNGSGVCFVLRKDDALRLIPPQLQKRGRSKHGPVTYRNERLGQAILIDLKEALDGDLEAIAEKIAEQHTDPLFLTKNTEWESEREYRFIVQSTSEYESVDVSDSLAAVCLGPATPKEARHAVGLFGSQYGLGVGLLEWRNNDPTLVGLPRWEL